MRVRILAGVGVLAAVLWGGWMLFGGSGDSPMAPGDSASPPESVASSASGAGEATERSRWPEGLVASFSLTYEDEGRAPTPGGESFAGEAQIQATLQLEVLARDEAGTTLIEWTLPKVERADWSLDGSAAKHPDRYRAALEGQPVWTQLSADGHLESVEAPEEGSKPFAQLVTRWAPLVLALEPTAADLDTGWGRVQAQVEELPEGVDGTQLAWRSSDYTSVELPPPYIVGAVQGSGRTSIRLRDGWVHAVHAREAISVETADGEKAERSDSLRLLRTRVERRAPRPSSDLVARIPAAQLRGDARQNALIERTRGLTWERLEADLLGAADSGKVKRHNDWLWRAAGLLKLQPELARNMVGLYFDERMGSRGRDLVFDLLANVGHAEAQAAVRTILSNAERRAEPESWKALQRVGLVLEPEAATIDVVETIYDAPVSPAEHRSAAAALGGMAQRAGAEDAGRATKIVDKLLAAVEGAEGADAAALVTGLGNSGDPRVEDAVVAFAGAEDASTRARAARALRGLSTERASGTLASMVGDASAAVQQSALSGLRHQEANPAIVSALTAAVANGQVAETTAKDLVRLVADWAGAESTVDLTPLVGALAAHPWRSKSVAHAAMELANSK